MDEFTDLALLHLRDFISEDTRRTRRSLLASSGVGILVGLSGKLPERLFGFERLGEPILLYGLIGAIIYFMVAFAHGVYRDLLMWVRQGDKTFTEVSERIRKEAEVQKLTVKQVAFGTDDLKREERITIFLGRFLEALFPLLFGVTALGWLFSLAFGFSLSDHLWIALTAILIALACASVHLAFVKAHFSSAWKKKSAVRQRKSRNHHLLGMAVLALLTGLLFAYTYAIYRSGLQSPTGIAHILKFATFSSLILLCLVALVGVALEWSRKTWLAVLIETVILAAASAIIAASIL